jgi:hypothetical protein
MAPCVLPHVSWFTREEKQKPMKLFKTFGMTGVLALAGLTLSSLAQAGTVTDSMRVHVPFAFVVAGQQFAAGDYTVQQTDSGIVWVRGGGKAALTLSFPAATVPGRAPGLRFAKSEEKAYLVGVQGQELGRSIPMHTYEQRKLTITSQ